MFNGKSIFISGGTGSFGRNFIRRLLEQYQPKRVVVFSRDELKQYEMQQTFNAPCMRYGNAAGSRGSVVPFFSKLISEGAV